MAETCRQIVQLCAMRVARLGSEGQILAGTGNLYVAPGPITLALAWEIEAKTEFLVKNGCDETCVSFTGRDKLKSITYTLNICDLDHELLELMIGGNLVASGGSNIGLHVPKINDTPNDGVSFEFWTKRWATSQQSAPGYFKFGSPKTTWRLGDLDFGNQHTPVVVIGQAEENDNFNNGPADDWVEFLESLFGWEEDSEIPEAVCGAQTTLAQVS